MRHASDKQNRVDDVFRRVAGRYDLMNDLMSVGLHRQWKGMLIDWLAPPRQSPQPWLALDIAGGSGDLAFRLAGRSPVAEIVLCDIGREMLAVAAGRVRQQNLVGRVALVQANAEDLPFPEHRFEAATCAFGFRNVPQLGRALSEALRVLRPGGRLMVLEFSAVAVAWLDRVYDLYSRAVIPRLGELVVGDDRPYRYLVDSIRRFPNQERFAAELRNAGFARVSYRNLTGGIVAIHSGWKI